MRPWMKFSHINSRENLAYYLAELGLHGVAVEVGVHRGDFCLPFLTRWNGDVMYLVDPWENNLPGYVDPIADGRDRNLDLETLLHRLVNSDFGRTRATILQYTSAEAAKKLRDDYGEESIDFVYIDANHARQYVEEDIELWYPLVKPGGILAGHDVINGPFQDVADAVEATLVQKRNYPKVAVISGDAWSWYIRKGDKND